MNSGASSQPQDRLAGNFQRGIDAVSVNDLLVGLTDQTLLGLILPWAERGRANSASAEDGLDAPAAHSDMLLCVGGSRSVAPSDEPQACQAFRGSKRTRAATLTGFALAVSDWWSCPMETLSVRSDIATKLAHHGEASSLIAGVLQFTLGASKRIPNRAAVSLTNISKVKSRYL